MLHILGHLIMTAVKIFWRLVFTAVCCALIGAGAVLLLTAHYANNTLQWPPRQMTIALLAGAALLTAYAGGVTVLMVEAVRALKMAAKAVEQEAVAPVKAVAQELESRTR